MSPEIAISNLQFRLLSKNILSLHGAQNQKHQFDVIVLEGVELACFNYWDISRPRPNQWWLNLAHHTYRERS
jgi:hypothetical protein